MFCDKLTLPLPYCLLQHTKAIITEVLGTLEQQEGILNLPDARSLEQYVTAHHWPTTPSEENGKERDTFPGPDLGLQSCHFTGYPMV